MVGVAPAANAPADFDPLDIRNALGGGEDAETAASVPEEMANALAKLTGAADADRAPMTMRMAAPGAPAFDSPTRIVPPQAHASERPVSDFASTVIQRDLDATIGADVPDSGGPPAPSSLARAAQTSFDRKPLERKPLVTTVAMSPIAKIPLPSAARGAAAGVNGTVAGVVRATRMPSTPVERAGVGPSNTPPRALSQEEADLPAPSEGATIMVSPEREAGRGPETAPPAPRPSQPSSPETKSVFAADAPAARALAEPAPSGPSMKFAGTLASALPLAPPAPPPESARDESTMMVLPEEIIEDDATRVSAPAASQPSDGGTMMLAPAKHAAPIAPLPDSAPQGTMMLAPANRAPPPTPAPAQAMPAPVPVAPPVPPAQPVASPRAAPARIAPNIKTSIGIAPPVFTSPGPGQGSVHGPMIPPTPIVSIAPAPPPQHTGGHSAMAQLASLPVRATVQLATTRSIPPPAPKPLPQTPVMPPAMRASYAQLPPHQWPAEQNMPLPVQAVPQGSIGPQSDPSRPLTYSVFDPAEAARVIPRSPSMPSRASISDHKPKMSVGMKIGLVVLGVCLVAGTAGAIILGASEDPPTPRPATSSSVVTPASAFVPVPVPPAADTSSAVASPPQDPPPTVVGDPTGSPATPTAPTSTGKQRKPKSPPGTIPPNPFGSSMPGKRK